MTEKFRNKYRVPSARHPYWDYSQNAAYFVTICTKNRNPFFGYIKNHVMIKTALGQYAHDCWQAIPQHFPFVRLGAFVVMPNHVHGIIIINRDDIQQPLLRNRFGPQSQNLASVIRGYKIGVTKMARYGGNDDTDAIYCVSGPGTKYCDAGTDGGETDAIFCVSTGIWQPRYHDHIIRNAGEYDRIETYIINNPARWGDDKFYLTR